MSLRRRLGVRSATRVVLQRMTDRAIDEARKSRVSRLEAAYKAACAFIDAHVADPDLTQEMRETHAEFVRLRKEIDAR